MSWGFCWLLALTSLSNRRWKILFISVTLWKNYWHSFYPSLYLRRKLAHTRDSGMPSSHSMCCSLKGFLWKIAQHPLCSFSVLPSPSPPKHGVWTILLRTFCHTWTPNHCVLLSLCARSGTAWRQTACCGRSSSREWSGQTLCGEAWQSAEGGEPLPSSYQSVPTRSFGSQWGHFASLIVIMPIYS